MVNLKSTTDKAFEDGISELNGMDNGIDNVYVEVPKVNLDNVIIITNKRVHEEIDFLATPVHTHEHALVNTLVELPNTKLTSV